MHGGYGQQQQQQVMPWQRGPNPIGMAPNRGMQGGQGMQQGMQAGVPLLGATGTTLTVSVKDDMVGAIVGRGGESINEMQSFSGARIKISQKGEFVPGTQNRIVTITGTNEQCQTAQYLIQQRLIASHQQQNGGGQQQQQQQQPRMMGGQMGAQQMGGYQSQMGAQQMGSYQ